MATGKAFNEKPYAGNPHVRFDEGADTPKHSGCSALLYKKVLMKVFAKSLSLALMFAPLCVRGNDGGYERFLDDDIDYWVVSDTQVEVCGLKNKSATHITIPSEVTYEIYEYVYDGEGGYVWQTRYKTYTVASIEVSAFYECSGLKSVTICNGVTSIGPAAFCFCSGLKSVTIPNSVKSIGEDAFLGCSGLTSVTIPSSVTSIEREVFAGCSGLKSMTIPNSVTSIGEDAFLGCSGLTSVTIPSSVTSIGRCAFYECSSLTSVTIPSSVTSIGVFAFSQCSEQTSINFRGAPPRVVDSAGNVSSGPVGYRVGIYPTTHKAAWKAVIDENRYWHDLKMHSNAGMYTVRFNTNDETDFPAFGDMVDQEFDIDEEQALSKNLYEREGFDFGGWTTYPEGVAAAYADREVVKNLTKKNGEIVELYALWIPKKVTITFCDNRDPFPLYTYKVYTVASFFHNTPGRISTSAHFDGWYTVGGERIWLGRTRVPARETTYYAKWSELGSSPSTVNDCIVTFDTNGGEITSGEEIWVVLPGTTIKEVGELPMAEKTDYDFKGWFTAVDGGMQVTPDTVVTRSVTYYAHWMAGEGSESGVPIFTIRDGVLIKVDLNGATEVTVPDGVTSIGWRAFAQCENLVSVVIPNGVTGIDGWAFESCRKLASVKLPLSLLSIGDHAFENTALESIDLPNGLMSLGEYAFAFSKLNSITIPSGITVIPKAAFGCCPLTHVTIPASVTSIGDWAFEWAFNNAPEAVTIVFEGNAPITVNSEAFSHSPDVSTYTAYVYRDSTGWGVPIPGIWKGMKIRYVGSREVIFDANGGNLANQTLEQFASEAWVVDGLQSPSKKGMIFGGWWTEKAGGEQVNLDGVCGLSSDTTLYARWLKAYNATVKTGSVSADDAGPAATVSAVNGTRLYLEAVDKSDNNMEFAYWSYTPATVDLGEDFDPRESHAECDMPEANVTFTANYVAKPGHVRVYAHEVNDTANDDGEPEGIEWSADGKFWFAANDDRAFPVKSGKTTFKFRSTDPRWTVPASATYVIDSDNAFRNIDIAATRVAIVEADSLCEQSGASGTVTLSPKNGQVLSGKPVTLTAKPGKDTVFAYWMVDGEKVGYTTTFKYAPDADCTVTAVFRLKSVVGDPELDASAVVPSANAMVGVAFKASVPIADAAYPAKFSAKGLPAGVKIDAASGVISGVPTKAGDYVVTIATAGGANGKTKSSMALPITIKHLPVWAQGTFTGYVNENGAEYGLVSLSVSGAGKVSGKIALNGTNWTFAATSYDATSHTDEEEEYNMSFAVVAEAKAGKNVFPLRFNVWEAAAPDGDGVDLLNSSALGSEMWGGNPVNVRFFRNIWKDKVTADASKAELAKREGVYTLSFSPDLCGEFGSGYLSLTVGKDGNVKATGKLADGTSISATSPLMYNADFGYFAYFYAAPSAYKGGVFALTVSFGEPLGALGNAPRIAQWKSRNPQASGEYGEGFSHRASFSGAYYDKLAKLNEYYDSLRFSLDGTPSLSYTYKQTYLNDSNKKVTESEMREVEAKDLSQQEGLSVAVSEKGALVVAKATKPVQDKETREWSYAGDNDGALTLSFAQATGIFKGSYMFWYDYMSANDETTDKKTYAHTSKKVSFEGIMVQGQGSMNGFYLWDATGSYLDEKTKKAKSYKYKLSFPVSLLSE